MDSLVLATAYTTLLNGNWTDMYTPFYRDQLYLQSYSTDSDNPFHYPLVNSEQQVYTTSGYFDRVRRQYYYQLLRCADGTAYTS